MDVFSHELVYEAQHYWKNVLLMTWRKKSSNREDIVPTIKEFFLKTDVLSIFVWRGWKRFVEEEHMVTVFTGVPQGPPRASALYPWGLGERFACFLCSLRCGTAPSSCPGPRPWPRLDCSPPDGWLPHGGAHPEWAPQGPPSGSARPCGCPQSVRLKGSKNDNKV